MTSSPPSRWVSLTFDDGFRRASEVAAEILGERGLGATFYIVTGWVSPVRAAVRDPLNRGCDHGDWAHWRSVRDAGHEVGSHTFSHFNVTGKMARLFPWLVGDELRKARDDLAREVPQPLRTISMTWNQSSRRSDRIVRTLYDGCRLGDTSIQYNDLRALDPYRLASWAPRASVTLEAYEKAVADLPDGGWLIFQFHSFDGEGWEPLSRDTFRALCEIVEQHRDVKVAPVAQVLAHWRSATPVPAAAAMAL